MIESEQNTCMHVFSIYWHLSKIGLVNTKKVTVTLFCCGFFFYFYNNFFEYQVSTNVSVKFIAMYT